MAITGKPQRVVPPSPPAPLADEETVRKLINKGGSIADAARPKEADGKVKLMNVQLRVMPTLLEEIDAVRKARSSKRRKTPSRHEWMLEALEEKLERERKV
jgi:hypothetical protein